VLTGDFDAGLIYRRNCKAGKLANLVGGRETFALTIKICENRIREVDQAVLRFIMSYVIRGIDASEKMSVMIKIARSP